MDVHLLQWILDGKNDNNTRKTRKTTVIRKYWDDWDNKTNHEYNGENPISLFIGE